MFEDNSPGGFRGCVPAPGITHVPFEDGGILFDLVGNRYISLSRGSDQIWQLVSRGCSLEGVSLRFAEGRGLGATQVAFAVEQQIRLWTSMKLVGSAPAHPRLPSNRLLEFDGWEASGTCDLRSNSYDLLLVAVTRAWASAALRFAGLPQTLVLLQSIFRGTPDHATIGRIQGAAARMRSVFGRREPDCLARSVGLAAALRLRGADAVVAVGVVRRPFRAHAWVEVGAAVVGESVEVVRPFRRIARF